VTKHICNLVLLTVLGASAAAAAEALPFEGKWATHGETCGGGTSSTDSGTPITVTASRLEALPFMSCDFKSVLPGGMSYRITASCDASGQKGEEFFTFAVLDKRLYWSWGGKTGIFERCPN
jgi:hypothetical protein